MARIDLVNMIDDLDLSPYDYRVGFDVLTEFVNQALVKNVTFEFNEYVMPDGEIQRWWTFDDQSLVLKYQSKRKDGTAR